MLMVGTDDSVEATQGCEPLWANTEGALNRLQYGVCRGNQYVECPFSKARFQPSCRGKLSPVGDIARIGADASGLLCSNAQSAR